MTTLRVSSKRGPRSEVPIEIEDDQGNVGEFKCRPQVPGSVLLEFSEAAAEDRAASVVLSFFRSAMADREHARFREFVDDPERIVDLPTLVELAEGLISIYSKRPTMPPSLSEPGRDSDGPMSTEPPPSQE